ncbi:TRAP transporter small permease [Pseudoprimorskyibacter insulae]|uniref:TRAP transporter small permease protein n=1 Tax=Pseudoprimorskyibacter insulae TaxID=1695997 RepID=A0A2R8AW23_9RHOB|nr:TRAP transporter small permease [Pseudoprimorskyibacter insulae]SPF80228.1 hypothetical protein PRI8871_02034 [Pseudoprimorskyibacter insulae]
MQRLHQIRDGLMSVLVLIGGLAVIALMVHVGLDVLSRNLSNAPIPATYEIVTEYYMVGLAFIPLAWVEKNGGMVQVEIMDSFMGPRMRRLSNIAVSLISGVIYGALTWVSWSVAIKNMTTGTFVMAMNVPVPTWPAHFMLPFGFGLAVLVVLLRAVDEATSDGAIA